MGSDSLLNIDDFKKIYEPYGVLIEKDEYVNDKCWYINDYVDQKLLRFKLTDGNPPESILGNECCAENRYYESKEERIVSIESINLHPDKIRGKKKMKLFIHKSNEVYNAHGYKKIVLKAIEDGIVAWYRMGFEYYSSLDGMKIFNEFRLYYKEINSIDCPYKSLREAKTNDFKHSSKSFTEWLKEKNYYGIRMLKEIKR